MYGAWIGDIAGCNEYFSGADSEKGLLFKDGNRLSEAGLLAAAVAGAIMKSRKEQFDHEKNARPFHDFVCWELGSLRPNGSKGFDTSVYMSPCGIVAVALKEATFMARICAEAAGDPGAVKEAETVAGAVFLAKLGKSKDEIRQFLKENGFDPASCRNSIEIAAACFFESTDFEDALRRAVRVDEGCRHSVTMIAASIAWRYYCAHTWNEKPNERMLQIQVQAEKVIPNELKAIEKEFHDVSVQRAGTYFRTGFCTSIMSEAEELAILQKEKEEAAEGSCVITENIQLPSDDLGFVPLKKGKKPLQSDSGTVPGPAVDPFAVKPEGNDHPDPFSRHTIWETKQLPERSEDRHIGSKTVFYDKCLGNTRMVIQLDKDQYWFLSIFFDSNTGKLQKYCLDYEGASDSHYEFKDEASVRKLLYQEGDNERYMEEIFIRFMERNTGGRLVDLLERSGLITAQFHFD